jgi:vanillate O-demethylase monooxygenase subunit
MATDNRDTTLHNEHPVLRRFWHPVARSDDVSSNPISVELLGERWCLVRIDGVLAALPDRCPHRFAPLSAGRVVDGTLECGYHGYRFAPDGTCVEIPAIGASVDNGGAIPPKANCRAAHSVTDHLGLVWLAPEEPMAPLPEVPEHDDPAFVHCPLPVLDWNAGAAQMVDNFLDQGHFPYLHLATFGAVDDRKVPDYDLQRNGHGFTVNHSHTTKTLADSHGADEFSVAERHDLFVFTPPHHVYLRIDYPADDAVLTISFCHQPVNAGTTRLYCTDYRNDIADSDEDRQAAVDFQLAVAGEDKAMLEQFPHKTVPLNPTAEVHTKADRITLEMRRIMAELIEAAAGESGE